MVNLKNYYAIVSLMMLLGSLLIQGAEAPIRDSRIHMAINENNYEKFCKLLNDGVSPESFDELGHQPIYTIMFNYDSRFLKELIKYKINVNTPIDYTGKTVLSLMCYSDKRVKQLKLLMKAGANVEAGLTQESPPFFEAFSQYIRYKDKTSCKEVMSKLIEGGANVAIKYSSIHPTLLSYVEARLNREEDKKQIAKYTWLKNLLINAQQIHIDYLKKQEEKRKSQLKIQSANGQLENLKNINLSEIVNIKDQGFNVPVLIAAERCRALLNLLS